MFKVGDKAPHFVLNTQAGQAVALSDFKGKKVVLYFYPKDNTSGCTREACDFQENLAEFQALNAEIVGVSPDSPESHAKFAGKYGLNFTLLSDVNKEVLQKYGVWKEKSMYGKKYMGVERTTFIIDENGIILKIFEKVKVNGHVNEISQLLKDK